MMKQPRFASKLRLSRLCRWILALGVMKLALLTGMLLIPSLDGRDGADGFSAFAANPFSTTPDQPQTAPPPRPLEVPAFGLVAEQAVATAAPSTNVGNAGGLNPPAPRINPSQTSPFAQPLPEYSRPDEATTAAPPPPSVKPIVPRDSASHKQEELDRRERELLALRQQMDSRLDELKKIEGNVQTMLQQADNTQNEKMRHLIDVYSNMKAKQAAEVLSTVDERIAVSILSGMRGRQAGEILTYMEAKKAAKLSEALTRTQLPR